MFVMVTDEHGFEFSVNPNQVRAVCGLKEKCRTLLQFGGGQMFTVKGSVSTITAMLNAAMTKGEDSKIRNGPVGVTHGRCRFGSVEVSRPCMTGDFRTRRGLHLTLDVDALQDERTEFGAEPVVTELGLFLLGCIEGACQNEKEEALKSPEVQEKLKVVEDGMRTGVAGHLFPGRSP